jgi:hypothetical protein
MRKPKRTRKRNENDWSVFGKIVVQLTRRMREVGRRHGSRKQIPKFADREPVITIRFSSVRVCAAGIQERAHGCIFNHDTTRICSRSVQTRFGTKLKTSLLRRLDWRRYGATSLKSPQLP